MNWSINGKTVKSLMKDGKEIVKVERAGDGKILYEKESNNNYVVATVTGNSIKLGNKSGFQWIETNSNVIIDWGDGTQSTVNNPTTPLRHTYTDAEPEHSITFIGEVTSIGIYCFEGCTGLTSIVIPDSVTTIDDCCFMDCTGLTSVIILSSVTNFGWYCFNGCTGLIDYQLYWTGNNIITYNSSKMPNNTNTIFTIPSGQTANYVAKSYPSNKLVERSS